MFTIPDFARAKREGRRLVMLTGYDVAAAQILSKSTVDAVLVGDSLAMVVHGQSSTLGATVELIATHVRAVRAGGPELCVVADMPFLSTRRGLAAAVDAAGALMQAGANAVKIEGLVGHEEIIPHLIHSGIPVMGHLGLTPQSVNAFGGYRVQGNSEAAARAIRAEAKSLSDLGCFGLVLECVPAPLAATITKDLPLAVIGIGAGAETDGQILVWHDLLGLGSGPKPRFVRTYLDGASLALDAIDRFAKDVRNQAFPNQAEAYGTGPHHD